MCHLFELSVEEQCSISLCKLSTQKTDSAVEVILNHLLRTGLIIFLFKQILLRRLCYFLGKLIFHLHLLTSSLWVSKLLTFLWKGLNKCYLSNHSAVPLIFLFSLAFLFLKQIHKDTFVGRFSRHQICTPNLK